MSFIDKITTKLINLNKDSIHLQDSTVFFLTSENSKYNLSEGQVIQSKGNKLQIKRLATTAEKLTNEEQWKWLPQVRRKHLLTVLPMFSNNMTKKLFDELGELSLLEFNQLPIKVTHEIADYFNKIANVPKVAHAISEKGNYFWIATDKIAYSIKDAEILFKKELGIVKPVQKKSSYLSVTKKANWGNMFQEDTFNKISNRNVQQKITAFLQNYLQNFDIHGRYAIKFDRLRNASTNDSGYLNKADVHVGLEIRSISGVKVVAELVVPVRNGEFVEPSVITYNGMSHIIAQSAFDEITNNNTFMRSPQKSFSENMSPKLVEHYRNTKIPLVQFGMFE